MDEPTVVTSSAPVEAAAVLVGRAVEAALFNRDRARLAVSGGLAVDALGPLRRQLAAAELWRRVHLTWVDERCVPFASPDSNRGQAYRTHQLDAAQPPGLELPLFLDHEHGQDAVERVEIGLREQFDDGLDVLLLGMGEDGHVASLFPGRVWGKAAVELVTDSPKPPQRRITLTVATLTSAESAILVAQGEAKRSALQRLVGRDPALPASQLARLQIVTDLTLTR